MLARAGVIEGQHLVHRQVPKPTDHNIVSKQEETQMENIANLDGNEIVEDATEPVADDDDAAKTDDQVDGGADEKADGVEPTQRQSGVRSLADLVFEERKVALVDVIQDDHLGRHSTESGLKSLASSLAQHGLLYRPKLYPMNEKRYAIATGRRRIAAATLADWTTIQADVATRHLTDDEVLRLDLEDNRQREDLHCIDETIQIARYVDLRAGLTFVYPDDADPLSRVRAVLALAKDHPNFPHNVVREIPPAKSKRGRPQRTFTDGERDRYIRVEAALQEVLLTGMTPASWLEHYLAPAINLTEDDRRRAVEYELSPTEVERLPRRLKKFDETGEAQKLSAKRWITPSQEIGWIVADRVRDEQPKRPRKVKVEEVEHPSKSENPDTVEGGNVVDLVAPPSTNDTPMMTPVVGIEPPEPSASDSQMGTPPTNNSPSAPLANDDGASSTPQSPAPASVEMLSPFEQFVQEKMARDLVFRACSGPQGLTMSISGFTPNKIIGQLDRLKEIFLLNAQVKTMMTEASATIQ